MKRGLSIGDLATGSNEMLSDGVWTRVKSRSKQGRRNNHESRQPETVNVNGNSPSVSQSPPPSQPMSTSKAQIQVGHSQQSHVCNVPNSNAVVDATSQSGLTADNDHQNNSQNTSQQALIDEIDSLKATVKVLQSRLSFVLSYLGIAENTDLSNAVSQSSSALSEVTTNGSEVTNGSQPTRSYADVIQRSTVPTALNGPLRQAVVSAVYADFEEKDRRAKNVIISGLPVTSVSDKTSVERLCQSEFGIIPKVVRCRRLGQPRPDRVQPLLTVLETVDEADYLIKNAKSLRQSRDSAVRSSVYVNPDLTKAEAFTAYQRRCRRRELAATRATVQPASASVTANNAASCSITVLNNRVPTTDQLPASSGTISATISQSTSQSMNRLSTVDTDLCTADHTDLSATTAAANE